MELWASLCFTYCLKNFFLPEKVAMNQQGYRRTSTRSDKIDLYIYWCNHRVLGYCSGGSSDLVFGKCINTRVSNFHVPTEALRRCSMERRISPVKIIIFFSHPTTSCAPTGPAPVPPARNPLSRFHRPLKNT